MKKKLLAFAAALAIAISAISVGNRSVICADAATSTESSDSDESSSTSETTRLANPTDLSWSGNYQINFTVDESTFYTASTNLYNESGMVQATIQPEVIRSMHIFL